MAYHLTWVAEVLLAAGLKVAECDGWRDRGRAEMGTVRGVMCHHTGTPQPGNMPTLNVLLNGRPDLRGPLANLGLGRDGTFYLVAAGRANHAGIGRFRDITAGNASFIGIEAEHSGNPADPWPEVQRDAYERGVAALLRQIGASSDFCVAHKEWALPAGRKVDPCFDMAAFRDAVSGWLLGRAPPPPILLADPAGRPTLRRGEEGDAVESMQDMLEVRADGRFGPKTEAALRAWQLAHALVPDGICGPKTWIALTDAAQAPPAIAPVAVNDAAEDGALTITPKGIALIHQFEGCARRNSDGHFEAYPDPGSRNGRPWTIGWGTTGSDIVKGLVWTQQQCDDRFAAHLQRYEEQVRQALAGAPTTQNQFDALVSFHYNTGAIGSATLTRRHRAGDWPGALAEFARWVRNDGKVLPGLVRRRQAEAALYALSDAGEVARHAQG